MILTKRFDVSVMFKRFEYLEEEKLVRFAKGIEQQFFTLTPYHFKYPIGVESNDIWDGKFILEIKKLNAQFLSNLVHNANLYMIYTRRSVTNEWKLKYLGERKSEGMRKRITSHLINKNDGTGAKLNEVKNTLRNS